MNAQTLFTAASLTATMAGSLVSLLPDLGTADLTGTWRLDTDFMAEQIKSDAEQRRDRQLNGIEDEGDRRAQLRDRLDNMAEQVAERARGSSGTFDFKDDGSFEAVYAGGVLDLGDPELNEIRGGGHWHRLDDGRVLVVGRWDTLGEAVDRDPGRWAVVFDVENGAMTGYAGNLQAVGMAGVLRYRRSD